MESTESSTSAVIGIGQSSIEGAPLLGREKAKFPKSVFFIISNELCERFSFYGLKAILYVYFLDHMLFSEPDSTAVVHGFIMVSYAFTLVGGYIADTLLGKYRTIFYLTFVYIVGASLLSLSAVNDITGTPPHWWLAMLGLLLIAFGTGGIKPCISSFVGDQFGPGQEAMLDNVFFLFYFFVNLGSLLSTILTPEIKKSSFVYAFGLPAVLLAVSQVIFFAGRKQYVKKVPSGNAYAEIFRVVSISWRAAREQGLWWPQLDWLDYARESCGQESVNSVRSLLRVAKVLLPISVFWSLYDQHSTRWISQAKMMDLEVFGYALEASQIPAMNPFLIVTSVPLFNRVIYPTLKKCGWNPNHLTRVGIGMILTAVSFALTALVQTLIDKSDPKSIWVGFQLPQYIILGFAEVMVSVTGLEFAYQQAPNSMKAVIMALFYCTVALGNLLVVVIALIEIPGGMAVEFWFFCGLMLLFTLGFSCLARNFPYQLHMAVPEATGD